MEIQVEELSPVQKKVSFVVESERVSRTLDDAYRKLGREIRIKGFRPGKVPLPPPPIRGAPLSLPQATRAQARSSESEARATVIGQHILYKPLNENLLSDDAKSPCLRIRRPERPANQSLDLYGPATLLTFGRLSAHPCICGPR